MVEEDEDEVLPIQKPVVNTIDQYSFATIRDIIEKVDLKTTKTQKEFNDKYSFELAKILLPASIDMPYQDIKISFSNEIREIDGIFKLLTTKNNFN